MNPLENVPERTALYRHFNSDGVLLYVGISLGVIARLRQHSDHSHWWDQIVKVEIQWLPSREEAVLAECNAIKSENPRYNLQGKPADSPPNRWLITRQLLMDRLVNGRLIYRLEDAAHVLSVPKSYLVWLIWTHKISSISLPCKNGRMKYPQPAMTAWQLYDFVEYLENQPPKLTRNKTLHPPNEKTQPHQTPPQGNPCLP